MKFGRSIDVVFAATALIAYILCLRSGIHSSCALHFIWLIRLITLLPQSIFFFHWFVVLFPLAEVYAKSSAFPYNKMQFTITCQGQNISVGANFFAANSLLMSWKNASNLDCIRKSKSWFAFAFAHIRCILCEFCVRLNLTNIKSAISILLDEQIRVGPVKYSRKYEFF